MIYITGASSGIGKVLFEHFSEEGLNVAGTYNHTVPESKNLKHLTKVDICNSKNVADWIAKNTDTSGANILINCAGINYTSLAHKADLEAWQNVINVNLIGTFNAIHGVLPLMRENGYGRIINFSSIVAQKGTRGTSAYAASKSALYGLAKSIAVENATKGITINNISLGYFDIGMIREVTEKFRSALLETIPNKSLGHPTDIISTVKYIIDTAYLNGTSIDLSAGLV
ncbi:SDR family NAD(P)-dependent oxidoreductase [Porticoccaceae bacterium]|nr:SDR family NAD(P)-dependent oxidoreductase [Porticoccaceae bacterium]